MKKKTRIFCLTLLFLSICFQNIQLFSFDGGAIKPYHVLALAFVPTLLRKIKFFPNVISVFLILILASSVVGMPTFGISSFLLNYMFAFLLLLIVRNMGEDFTQDEWISLIKKVAFLMMGIIWIKNILQIAQIIAFFKQPYGHPLVTTFFGGGVNLEATYMAMLIPFFKGDKRMWIYHIGSLALSLVYVSRTALVINILVIMWFGVIYVDRKYWGRVVAGITVILVAFIILYSRGSLDYMINRMVNIGKEAGSLGRFRMWRYFFEAVYQYPLGVGIGNSIDALRTISGIAYGEDNLHNIYMQMVLDLGICGGLYYAAVILVFLYQNRREIFRNAIIFTLILYIIASLVQFRGAEAFVYFIMGVYWQMSKYQNRESS